MSTRVQATAVGAESWAEAGQLFRSDSNWVGGDGAYSAQVSDNRVVWVFMDSLVCQRAGAARRDMTFLNNSVGIQHGLDPSTATMEFFWGTGAAGKPTSFFPPMGSSYLWPGNVTMVDGTLLLFFMLVRERVWEPTGSGDPHDVGPLNSFDVHDWVAIAVDNPEADPPDWNQRVIDRPLSDHVTTMGTGGLFEHAGYLYCFGLGRNHGAVLGRWSAERAASGDLGDTEWWYGDDIGWAREADRPEAPLSLMRHPHTEFSVHYHAPSGRWAWIQMDGLFEASVCVRWADRPEGPWSDLMPLWRAPESDRDDAFVYGGKAHPEQTGSDLVVTYNSNGTSLETILEDSSLYFPSFVRLTVDASTPAAPADLPS